MELEQYIEQYINDYSDEEFNPNLITRDKLLRYCKTFGEFFYIINTPLSGNKLCVANTSTIQKEIISDLENCAYIEHTHEVDDYLKPIQEEFRYDYIAVFKLVNIPNEQDYYIVYQEDK